MTEIETLYGYAEQFLDRVRSPSFEIGEFRGYLGNLEEDISTLSDRDAAQRISAAMGSLRKCDYVFRNHPDMKNRFVLPAAEALVSAIKKEISQSA